jgi:hypothetical protein
MADWLLVTAFCVLLVLPAMRTYLDIRELPAERRHALKSQPMWKLSRSFPASFEAFFNEQFGFRPRLLHWFRQIKVCWLHVSTSPRVALGKNGWLFYSPMAVGEDHPVARPFTPELMDRWGSMFQARHDWLAARGIPYVLLIAPDKQTVYPEALPRNLRRRTDTVSRLDQLLEHMQQHCTVQVIDVRDDIREAKARERVYDQTDSHWNERGAYVAYASLMTNPAKRHPQLSAFARERFRETEVTVPGGDCARLIGLPEQFQEVSLKLQPVVPRLATRIALPGVEAMMPVLLPFATEHPCKELPCSVIFHDSFGGHLVPFLAEHFRRAVFAWERPDYPVFNSQLVLREQPDIVIQQIVERKLAVYHPDGVTTNDPRCETPASWSRCSERTE